MCLARECLLPLLPPREERAGERRAVQPAGAAVCQQRDAPLPDPLPVRSSRGENSPKPIARLEPLNHPLTRPSGTLSPTGGEGWGEAVVHEIGVDRKSTR